MLKNHVGEVSRYELLYYNIDTLLIELHLLLRNAAF